MHRFASALVLRRLAWLVLIGGLALGAGARAQTLGELYSAARAYDATYLSARAQADSVQYRAAQANALRLPTVGLSAGLSRSIDNSAKSETCCSSTTVPAANPASAPVFVPSTATEITRTTGATVGTLGISAQQPLFNRVNDKTIEQAGYTLSAAEQQLRGSEQDLMIRLSQAYFDVLAARDALGTVQTSKKAISEQLASAKRNFEVGTATITDTREAQARFDLSVAQELAGENDLRVKQLALDQLVGRTGVDPKGLALPVVLPAPTDTATEWVARSEAESPAIQTSKLALDLAKAETEKARAGELPTVTLQAGYSRPYTRSGQNTVTDFAAAGAVNNNAAVRTDGLGRTASVGVVLSMPLFSGWSIQNRIKETLSLEEKARQDLDATRRTIAQATRTAFFGTQSGLAQVKALEAAESSSKLALEATQLGYKVGVRVNLDVLNAQTQLFTTQRDLSKARYDAVVSGLRLRQAAGTLTPSDIDAINQLLIK